MILPVKNFYMVSVQKFSRKQDIASLLNPRIFTRLTEDTDFNGTHFEDSFRTLFQKFSIGDSVVVTMANVNEDYYQFLKIRNDRFRFSDFSSEPFNYPTNVKDGLRFLQSSDPGCTHILWLNNFEVTLLK